MTWVCHLLLCGFNLFIHSGIQLTFECQLSEWCQGYFMSALLDLEIILSWLMSPPGHTDEGTKGDPCRTMADSPGFTPLTPEHRQPGEKGLF